MTRDASVFAPKEEFSSLAEIRNGLSKIRRAYNAEFSLLVVFELPNKWYSATDPLSIVSEDQAIGVRPRKLFRSLTLVSHPSRRQARLIVSQLQAQPATVGTVRLPWTDASAGRVIEEPPFSLLSEGFPTQPASRFAVLSLPIANDPIHPIASCVILAMTTPVAHPPTESVTRQLAKLRDLVIRSEAVSVNRSITIGDTIDLVLRESLSRLKRDPGGTPAGANYEQPDIEPLAHLSKAVTLAAVVLTDSEVGNLCVDGKDTQNLYLAGHCVRPMRPDPTVLQIRELPEGMHLSSPFAPVSLRQETPKAGDRKNPAKMSVIQYVHYTGRPVVINNVRDFEEMHQIAQYTIVPLSKRKPPRKNVRELAVPLSMPHIFAQPPRGPDHSILASEPASEPHDSVTTDDTASFGVLNLEKRSGAYGPDDLYIARNLAQYFCAQRPQVLSDVANVVLAGRAMSDSNSQLEPHELVRHFCTLSHDALDSNSEMPVEFSLAKESVAAALKALYLSTRSCHVTVRLATPDSKALVRFAEWPPGKGLQEFEKISTRHAGSVNSWVFRNSKRCYLRNMNAESRAIEQDYPGLQGVIRAWTSARHVVNGPQLTSPKSELCYPVLLRGRLVGTLDLESNYYAAYGPAVEESVRVMVEEIQLSLSRAQLLFEHELLLTLATTRLSSHEVLGVADDLSELSKTLGDEGLASSLLGKAERLSQIVSQVSSIPFLRGASERSSIEEVIRTAQGTRQFLVPFEVRDPESLSRRPLIPANLAFHLSLILKPLFRNAAQASRLTPKATIRLIPRLVSRNGRKYLAISVSNPIQPRQVPSPRLSRALYRLPTASDRWHLGGFLAGALARSLGGDVYAAINQRRRNIQVIVEVPLPEEPSPSTVTNKPDRLPSD